MEEDILSCKLDRISTLPVEVKDTILTLLPLREAVRTGVLSTKWRYCWVNISKLVIDMIFLFSKDDELLARYKLLSIINQIVILRDEPIHEFSLYHSVLDSCHEIDRLMIYLSKKSMQKFSLKILKAKHKLHSSLFSCQELVSMNLTNCLFTPPPAFKGFPRLVSLKLVTAVFSTDIFLNLISSCHQLESLTLMDSPKFHCLTISAPNLKYLCFFGRCEFFHFGDVPLLQSVSLNKFELSRSLKNEEPCRFIEFFARLPSLKKFSANNHYLAAGGGVPRKLLTSISLETLSLSLNFDHLDDVSSILCLISSSPCIRRIDIQMCPGAVEVDEAVDFLKTQDHLADVTLDELKEVHLTGVSGLEPELEFIKLLLAKSPALRTMLIITSKKKEEFSRFELLKKLTRFQRASSRAEIIYK